MINGYDGSTHALLSSFGSPATGTSSVSVSGATHDVYATNFFGDGLVYIFGPDTPAAPTVSGEVATASSVSATLNAQVAGNGSDTHYYFEYVDDADYNPGASDPYSAGTQTPAPPGADAGAGYIERPTVTARARA